MAPEIYNRNYDGDKVDIFASGIVLFQMFAILLPFEQALAFNSLYKNFKNEPYIYWK